MDGWTVHWLEAAGSLSEWRGDILGELHGAHEILSSILRPPIIDILIQRQPDNTLAETGKGGRAYSEKLLALTIDPENPNFVTSLRSGELRRSIVHEVHHCLRNAGPGYGCTLGDALVSEGLAGRFVRRLFGNDPELWEKAVTRQRLEDAPVDVKALNEHDYDHPAWFFGGGSLRVGSATHWVTRWWETGSGGCEAVNDDGTRRRVFTKQGTKIAGRIAHCRSTARLHRRMDFEPARHPAWPPRLRRVCRGGRLNPAVCGQFRLP